MASFTARVAEIAPPRVRAALALWSVLRLTLWYGGRACWAQRRRMDVETGERWAARWAQSVGRRLPLDVRHCGVAAPSAAIIVANHRSYLDVVPLLQGTRCGLLAKAEVGAFPWFRKACSAAGTTFVARNQKQSRSAARRALIERAQAGGRVALFPEGTTSATAGCLPFRPGIFHDAASVGLGVQPVALHYPDTAAPYVDDDHMLSHFLTLFRRRSVRIHVVWGPVLRGDDGERLRAEAERWVQNQLAALAAMDPVGG